VIRLARALKRHVTISVLTAVLGRGQLTAMGAGHCAARFISQPVIAKVKSPPIDGSLLTETATAAVAAREKSNAPTPEKVAALSAVRNYTLQIIEYYI
jgi:hypothetical protein